MRGFLEDKLMKQKATFCHAGCPVCNSAERSILGALDNSRFDVEIVHLGSDKARVAEAEKLILYTPSLKFLSNLDRSLKPIRLPLNQEIKPPH